MNASEVTITKPRKTQLQRKREAKADIVAASFVCFGNYGYQKTSLQKIAAQAGCSKELPRYHFGSKDELVKHLLSITKDDWTALFDAPAKQGIYGKEAFDLIFKNFGTKFAEDDHVLKGQLALILGASDPSNEPLRALVIVFNNALKESVKNTLRHGLPSANAVPEDELGDLAILVLGSSRGFTYQWLLDQSSVNIEAMFKLLAEMIALKLQALTVCSDQADL